MASKELVFEGVALYANLPPRAPQKAEETNDTSYSVQLECTEERFKELRKLGISSMTLLKKFPEDYVNKKTGEVPTEPENAIGKSFIRLKASKYREKTSKGPITFNDIPVVDEEGYIIEDSIANGSTMKAIVSLDDIKGKPGKTALRLAAVVVTDLIVWDGDGKGAAALKGLGIEIKKRPGTAKVEAAAYTPTSSNVDVEEGDDEFLGQE